MIKKLCGDRAHMGQLDQQVVVYTLQEMTETDLDNAPHCLVLCSALMLPPVLTSHCGGPCIQILTNI